MNGRLLVLVLVVAALAGALGAAWYRHAARPGLARQLTEESRRGQAFRKLLSLNGLFGSGREGFCDASASSPGLAYVQGRSKDGRLWHVVRASTPSATGSPTRGAFVFTEDGDVAHYLEGGVPFVLTGAAGSSLAALLAPDDKNAQATSVWFVDKSLEKKLSIRGSFGIQAAQGVTITVDKPPQAQPPDPRLPLFYYDPQPGCWRGPQAGADKTCEILRDASPGYCE